MTNIIMFIATGAYSGYLPKAPGTWGTLVAFPIHYLIVQLPKPYYAFSLAAIFIIAIITAGMAEKIIDRKDPGLIVIDEIIGMLIALAGIGFSFFSWIIAFALFRFFDIVKPFPVSWFDKKINGGTGIVMDDVIAGFYAWIILQILLFFFGPF